MSSDSRPSFRLYSKNKFKQIFKSNLTSSIISNETLNKFREKSQNLTENVKDFIHYETIKNKTKTILPERFQSNDNITSIQGFFDSLFSPQTEADVYFKVAIICLWVIAMLFILLTIITIFITYRKIQTKINVIKMIFLHLFLSEFFYLIYILLSMINVGMNFQLNYIWCNIAKYGMYVTVPMTCIILLILVIERLTRYFGCGTSWTNIFTNLCGSQSILFVIWSICISILIIFIYVKIQVKESIENLSEKILSNRFNFNFNKIFSSNQCSIDGQLLPPFKILFLILFIILIVLIIKSIVVSTMYTFIKPSCCKSKKNNQKRIDHNMTLILILIILFNLVFSFPFYFISAYDSIRQFFGGNKIYPMKLKISFILRLLSIILQCLIFYVIENNSWNLLCQLLDWATCRKFSILKQNSVITNRSNSTEQSRIKHKSKNNIRSHNIEVISDEDENNDSTELSGNEETDDDDVVPNEITQNPSKVKKVTTQVEITTDEDDSDTEIKPKSKLPNRIQKIDSKLSQEKDEIKEEKNESNKRITSRYNNGYGIIKQTSNGKLPLQQIPSTITDHKPVKSNTNQDRIKYNPIQSDTSTDEFSDANITTSDKIKPTVHSSSNKRKHTSTISPNEQRRHRYRTTHSHVSRPIRTLSHNYNHRKPIKHRSHSTNNTETSKQHHSSKIHHNAVEV